MAFKNEDYIDVYMDGNFPLYFNGALKGEGEYRLEPKSNDGEIYLQPISYATLMQLNRTKFIKKQIVRISEDIEEEVLKFLRIDYDKEKYSYSTEQIDNMILNSNDEVIREIVSIKDKDIVKRFLSELIGLQSTNKYDISQKLENYIRARLEELEEGKLETEFEVTETLNVKNVETAVVPEEVEETKDINEKSEVSEAKKKVAPKKKTTSK